MHRKNYAYAFFAVLLVMAIDFGCSGGLDDAHDTNESRNSVPMAEDGQRDAPSEPEDVVRRALLAMLRRDETAIRASFLPHANLHLFWQAPELSNEVIREEETVIGSWTLRRLSVGDEFAARDGHSVVVTQELVSDELALVTTDFPGMTFRLGRTGRRWQVDPTELLDASREFDANITNLEQQLSELESMHREVEKSAAELKCKNDELRKSLGWPDNATSEDAQRKFDQELDDLERSYGHKSIAEELKGRLESLQDASRKDVSSDAAREVDEF